MNNMAHYIGLINGDVLSIITDTDNFVDSDVDVSALKDAIKNNRASSCFRIYVLYPDETINYEIPLEDIGSGGSYSENYQNGQRRSLSFTLYNYDKKYSPSINTFWAGTRLRFDMGLRISDNETYWFKKGVFIVTSVVPSLTDTQQVVTINASDKFCLFDDKTGILPSTYEVESGTDISTLIHDILRTNIGNGDPLDSQDFILHSSFKNKKTQVKISKNSGDTFGSLLLDIATQLSAEVFYNTNGNLVYIPINEVTQDQDKPLVFSFETEHGDISQLDFNLDYSSIVNRVIVIGSSETGGTYIADKKNNDSSSPLYGGRIGYRVGNIINDPNIYSQVLADERAEYELRQQLIMKSSVSSTVVFNPFLDVNTIITISDDFFHLTYERFLIQSISCSLDFSNQMNISFSNLNNLPFVVK